jgi:putative redox protein
MVEAEVPYLTVSRRGAHRFEVEVEGHRLTVDEGVAGGGRDAGPTPTELLAASLASCAAAHAEAYLVAHAYATDGLTVACHYQLSHDQPPRVGSLDLTVRAPSSLPDEHRRDLLKAVEQCVVGNTLRTPPVLNMMVASTDPLPSSGGKAERP